MSEKGKMSINELKKKKKLGGWIVNVEKKRKGKKNANQILLQEDE